jgi:RNA recognition motif-containing protein
VLCCGALLLLAFVFCPPSRKLYRSLYVLQYHKSCRTGKNIRIDGEQKEQGASLLLQALVPPTWNQHFGGSALLYINSASDTILSITAAKQQSVYTTIHYIKKARGTPHLSTLNIPFLPIRSHSLLFTMMSSVNNIDNNNDDDNIEKNNALSAHRKVARGRKRGRPIPRKLPGTLVESLESPLITADRPASPLANGHGASNDNDMELINPEDSAAILSNNLDEDGDTAIRNSVNQSNNTPQQSSSILTPTGLSAADPIVIHSESSQHGSSSTDAEHPIGMNTESSKYESNNTTAIVDDNNQQDDDDDNNTSTDNPHLQRLSKWARRLFDPHRPRGLVEGPHIIPLNDEFLTAFGQREQAFDAAMGRQDDMAAILDLAIDDEDENSNNDDGDTKKEDDSAHENGEVSIAVDEVETVEVETETTSRKVRINNLKFTTKLADLKKKLISYGPIQKLELIMNKTDPKLNDGRAYCTFETLQAAQACVDHFKTMDGRLLRVSLAMDATVRTGKRSASALNASRYYQMDISVQCNRCGEIGHKEKSCPNAAQAKPCAFCALTDPPHDVNTCPDRLVCFHCSLCGHLARDCPLRSSKSNNNNNNALPRRSVCTLCFSTGHVRQQCRKHSKAPHGLTSQVICMDCGENGHYTCRPLQHFFDIQTVTCYNCGLGGHVGYECLRPNFEVMSRNEALVAEELEQQQAMEDPPSRYNYRNAHRPPGRQNSQQQQSQGGRGEHTRWNREPDRQRSSSAPPRPAAKPSSTLRHLIDAPLGSQRKAAATIHKYKRGI